MHVTRRHIRREIVPSYSNTPIQLSTTTKALPRRLLLSRARNKRHYRVPCLGESDGKTNGNLHYSANTLFLFRISFGFEDCKIRCTKEKAGSAQREKLEFEIKIN